CTPSSRFAALASTETMRACGCVLRSSLPYSMRGNAKSSANLVAPVTFATASTLRRALPMMRRSALPPIQRLPRGFGLFAALAGTREAEDEARQHGRSIQQHGARAALPELAAVLGAGESEVFAQHFEQGLMRRERDLGGFVVQGESDFDFGFVAHGLGVI